MDTSKRLIPYSVHLTPEIYEKLKEVAQERRASKMVRDAITMIINGKDEYNSGYNKALDDVAEAINLDQYLNIIGIEDEPISARVCKQLMMLVK
jgi:predicted DNA-binding protein